MRGPVKLDMARCTIKEMGWQIYRARCRCEVCVHWVRPLACSCIVHLSCETQKQSQRSNHSCRSAVEKPRHKDEISPSEESNQMESM